MKYIMFSSCFETALGKWNEMKKHKWGEATKTTDITNY